MYRVHYVIVIPNFRLSEHLFRLSFYPMKANQQRLLFKKNPMSVASIL